LVFSNNNETLYKKLFTVKKFSDEKLEIIFNLVDVIEEFNPNFSRSKTIHETILLMTKLNDQDRKMICAIIEKYYDISI